MEQTKWNILNSLVDGVKLNLESGKHSTSDEWDDLSADLFRAAEMATEESERLALEEGK